MRGLIAVFLVALFLQSDSGTQLSLDQLPGGNLWMRTPLSCPASTFPEGVMAFSTPLQTSALNMAAMELVCVQFNPSQFIFDSSTSPPTLKVSVPAAPTLYPLPNFADGEVPMGAVDGVNGTFTLMHTPNPPTSLQVFVEGVLEPIDGSAYGSAAQQIGFLPDQIPTAGASLLVYYRY